QGPASVTDRDRAVELHHGAFFPFGLKEYRLRRFLRDPGSGSFWRRVTRPGVQLFRLVLFQFGSLAPICGFALIAMTVLPRRFQVLPGTFNDFAALLLGFLLMAATVLIIVEAVYGYAVLGSYSAFHLLDPQRAEPGRRLVGELQVFIGILMTALLSAVGVVYFTSVRFGGYEQMAGSVTTPTQIAGRVADSAYYTFMAFLGSGEAGPRSISAKLVTGMLGMEGFSLLVLVLGMLASTSLPPAPTHRAAPSDPPTGGGATRHRTMTTRWLIYGALTGLAVAAAIRHTKYRKPTNR
ncbi:MAG TPA: hypothetical protein VF069_17620, partial [Streptosporangiaceae bacterium]